MKKTIILIAALACLMTSCSDFLDENPDKSGNSVIYHIDQLDALMGDYEIYNNANNYLWNEMLFTSDDVEFNPYLYSKNLFSDKVYTVYSWNRDIFENEKTIESCSWTGTYKSMFVFNTVLDNLDKVEQTSPEVNNMIRGEALFGRAYFHFFGLVAFAKYDMDAMGIGYRDNVSPGVSPKRETVRYTLSRIDEDLDNAEKALSRAGRTEFEIKRNFRVTLPTVYAFRARVELYKGDYEKALKYAELALSKYNYLLDFKKEPLYEVFNEKGNDANMLDKDGNVVGVLPHYEMTLLLAKGQEQVSNYPEAYLPHCAGLYFSSRAMPMSESLYNLFDKENDERFKRFYGNNNVVTKFLSKMEKGFTYESQQNLKEWEYHTYVRFVNSSGSASKNFILAPTTAEMYLIKAECLARQSKISEAKAVMETLRATRFTTTESANKIGGTVEDVINERRREFAGVLRWYDIKRLNGKENANITIKRKVCSDPYDPTSEIIEIELKPNDSFYAFPIPFNQLNLMGWEQN